MKIIYAGTPDFARVALDALIASGQTPVAVYTQPDRPAGRGRKLQPSPVKQSALDANIPVEQPLNFKDEADIQRLRDYKPDLMIVAAYGLILPQAVLDIPTHGCINIHASLLPRWRGAAPIQRAIAAGDEKTGICIMQMEAGLDTGPVLSRIETPISATQTGGELHDTLAELGGQLLLDTLPQLQTLNAEPQDDALANYASKLVKAEAKLDFNQDAASLSRLIHAFNPWPAAFTEINGARVRFLRSKVTDVQNINAPAGTILAADDDGIVIQCGSGQLCIQECQWAGKRAVTAGEAARGHTLVGVQCQ